MGVRSATPPGSPWYKTNILLPGKSPVKFLIGDTSTDSWLVLPVMLVFRGVVS